MSPVPVDPGAAIAHAAARAVDVNARFGPLYQTLDPGQVGITDSNVAAAAAIAGSKIGTGISGSKLTALTVTADKLQAPILGQREPFYRVAASMPGGTAGGTTYFPFVSGNFVAVTGTRGADALAFKLFQPTDYAGLTGVVPRLRLRAAWATNGTAPGVNFTVGLYLITGLASANNAIGVNAVTGVSGATVTLGTPAAGSVGSDVSADFLMPSGTHIIGVVPSGTVATNSFISFALEVDLHQA
jgi:hypothetical protein